MTAGIRSQVRCIVLLSCDVTLLFSNGQPGYTCQISEADKPRDKEHAITLAKLNASAKGWDIKFCDEAIVSGMVMSRK